MAPDGVDGCGVGNAVATTATLTTAVGAGLILPYYGAEDFGLHAIATSASVQFTWKITEPLPLAGR